MDFEFQDPQVCFIQPIFVVLSFALLIRPIILGDGFPLPQAVLPELFARREVQRQRAVRLDTRAGIISSAVSCLSSARLLSGLSEYLLGPRQEHWQCVESEGESQRRYLRFHICDSYAKEQGTDIEAEREREREN